jgi:chromosome segregation ATPase
MREEIGELKEKIQRHEGEINDLYSLKLKNYMRIKDAEKDVARLGSALYEKEQEIVSAKSKLCDCEQQQLEMGSSLVEKNA